MRLTKEQLMARLLESLSQAESKDSYAPISAVTDFLKWCFENQDSLDEEAKSYVDTSFEKLVAEVRKNVDQMPDIPLKRGLARQIGIADGQHFKAEHLIGILAKPSPLGSVVGPPANEFTSVLQHVLDVLFDVTRRPHEGLATLGIIGLGYWAVDELLAAFHLAQHAFINQASTHIRTVWEILDKIELFHQQPKWAEFWATGSDREVYNELKPSSVRQKLGEQKHDALYSFFSAIGPHATFRGLQARAAREVPRDGKEPTDEREHYRIWVGGSPFEGQIVLVNTICVYAALGLLVRLTSVFASNLHPEEIVPVLDSAAQSVGEFIKTYFLRFAQEEGIPADELLRFLEEAPWRKKPG